MATTDNKTLLLVEDEMLIAMDKQQELEKHGYSVITANTGEKAVSIINENDTINLILMDIDLGRGIDGTVAAEQILKEHDIPIVFMSSHTEPEIIQKTEKVTSYGYVVKSSNISVLDSSIKMAYKLFKAHRKVNISEERLNTLLNTITVVAGLTESDGTFILANDAYANSLGCTKEELVGKSMFDFFSSEVSESRKLKLEQVVNSKNSLQWEDERAGRCFSNTVYPIIDNTGNVTELAIFVIETTKNKEVDEKLQELAVIVEQSPNAIVITNLKGNVEYINPEFCNLSGYSKEELIGKNLRILQSGETPEKVYKELWQTVLAGKVWKGEFINKKKNGELFRENAVISPVYDNSGNIAHLAGIKRDITERKQAEEEVKKLLKEKEMLLKEVHHRIKNNMNTISSLLSMQADEVNNPDLSGAFQDAISRIESMGVLYDKLYRSEKYEEVSIKEYLSYLTEEIIEIFPGNKIKIEKHIDSFFVDTKIIFALGIIVNELITNAMKYAFAGRAKGIIKVSVKRDNNHIILIFQDNGIGMSEQESKEGKGFGLRLIDMLINQIEGSYRIENTKGTRYTIEFDI